jgi:rRNA maturation protein Rpf1
MKVGFTYNSLGIYLEPESKQGRELLKKLSKCFNEVYYIKGKNLFVIRLTDKKHARIN